MTITHIPPGISQQSLGRIGIALEHNFKTSRTLLAAQIRKEFPRVGLPRWNQIRRRHIQAPVIRTVPPIKNQFIGVGTKVALMPENNVFIKNIIRENRLDGAAITLTAVHFNDVGRYRRAAQRGIVIFNNCYPAYIWNICIRVKKLRIGNNRKSRTKGTQWSRFIRNSLDHQRHCIRINIFREPRCTVNNNLLFQTHQIIFTGFGDLIRILGTCLQQGNSILPLRGTIQIFQLFHIFGGQDIRLQNIDSRRRSGQGVLTNIFIINQTKYLQLSINRIITNPLL